MTRGTNSTALLLAVTLSVIAVAETAHAARFSIGSATGLPGDAVEVIVALDHEGRSLDFTVEQALPDGLTVAVDEGGAPDCRRLRFSHALQFTLLPDGCEPGVDCDGLRVAGDFRSLDEAGSRPLYGCQVAVPSGAAGARTLACGATAENVSSGQPQAAGCDSGTLEVIDGAALVIGTASAPGGAQTTLTVRLSSNVAVAGFAHDLVLPDDVAVLSDGTGAPRCLLAPMLPAQCGHFEYLPAGCTPGESCTGMRVGVDVPCNTQAIADETVVYACDMAISADAEDGIFPITVANATAVDASGAAVALLVRDGSITTQESRIELAVFDVGVRPGESGRLTVRLSTNQDIAGLTHELGFEPETPIAADGTGRPVCTTFVPGREALIRFIPQGCTPGTCTGISVQLPALGLEPLPRLSTLYQCEVTVAAGVPLGFYPLRLSAIAATGPSGNPLPNPMADDGEVGVFDEFPATIVVGSAQGAPGTRVSFAVTLDTEVEVAGTQNDLAFEPETRIAAQTTGRPSCWVNPMVLREGAAFAFRPSGCTPATTCTGIRALILSLSSVDPFPDGSTLYECDVDIATDASPGTYALRTSEVGASDPDGVAVFVGGSDGAIEVANAPPTATATPPGPTTSPAATATVMATATAPPTATRSAAPTAIGPSGDQDDDGCAVTSRPRTGGWLVLAPLLLLVLRRRWRRSRPPFEKGGQGGFVR